MRVTSSGTGNGVVINIIILNHGYCINTCLHSGYHVKIRGGSSILEDSAMVSRLKVDNNSLALVLIRNCVLNISTTHLKCLSKFRMR